MLNANVQVYNFTSKLFTRLDLNGKALKIAVKQHEDKQTKETDRTVNDILQSLKWDHVVRYEIL